MARSPREVLLEEARDRHKLELARYTEAHTRIGVHLAILGFFALTLVRYIDKLPPNDGSFVFRVFGVTAVVLCGATLIAFSMVLAVIWGFGTRFPAPMKAWRENAEGLRASYAGQDEVERRVAEELERRLMENMCEAADDNAAKNKRRSKFIVHASRWLVVSAAAFVVSGFSYLYLSLGKDEPTAVHITAPVQVQFQDRPGGE
jgi:hypothetical protein